MLKGRFSIYDRNVLGSISCRAPVNNAECKIVDSLKVAYYPNGSASGDYFCVLPKTDEECSFQSMDTPVLDSTVDSHCRHPKD